jgi:hypothetical protein
MRLEIELRCILFPLIILDWSPPVENSIDWTWFGNMICHYKVPQMKGKGKVGYRISWQCMSEKKSSHEVEGIVRRAPRQDLAEEQIWGRVAKNVCSIEGPQEQTCSRVITTSDWGEGSPSNRTTTLSTQPRQCRSGFGTSLWMSLSGPARARTWTRSERPENSCAATLPIQSDRAWEDLQWRMGETPQI